MKSRLFGLLAMSMMFMPGSSDIPINENRFDNLPDIPESPQLKSKAWKKKRAAVLNKKKKRG